MNQPRGKQKYTRDELIDIMKRNAHLFKDDEVFTQYVIDLATFLVEYRLHVAREQSAPAADPYNPSPKRTWLSRTRERDQDLERVLKKHATQRDPDANCKMCGSPTSGRITCPNCGNMTV